MKLLLPILAALLAFVAGRLFTSSSPAAPPAVPPPLPEAKTDSRPPSGGLAYRAARISANSPEAFSRTLHGAEKLPLPDLLDLLPSHAEKDPEGTWNWIESHPWKDHERTELLSLVASIWFAKDPQAVISKLRAHDHRDWKISASLVAKIASPDAAEASLAREHLELLAAFAGNFLKDVHLPKLEKGGAELLFSLPDGRAKIRLIGMFAPQWLSQDFNAAKAWLDRLPTPQREDILTKFNMSALRDRSPEVRASALDWLTNEATPSARARAGPVLVENMAIQDPAAALAWANEHLASGTLAAATSTIITRLQARNPELARRTVEDLPPGDLRHRAAAELAKHWSARDPAAAIAWWLGQVSEAEASRGGPGPASTLGKQWFGRDPDSFRRHLADPDAIELPSSLIYPAIGDMMKTDIQGTLDWLASLPEQRRADAAGTAFQHWAWQDPGAAAVEFTARPGLATPRAAQAIAGAWFDRDSEAAISWVAGLPGGEARQAALQALKKGAEFEVQLGGEMPARLEELLR